MNAKVEDTHRHRVENLKLLLVLGIKVHERRNFLLQPLDFYRVRGVWCRSLEGLTSDFKRLWHLGPLGIKEPYRFFPMFLREAGPNHQDPPDYMQLTALGRVSIERPPLEPTKPNTEVINDDILTIGAPPA